MILQLKGTALTVFFIYFSVISHLAGPLEFKGKGISDKVAALVY